MQLLKHSKRHDKHSKTQKLFLESLHKCVQQKDKNKGCAHMKMALWHNNEKVNVCAIHYNIN